MNSHRSRRLPAPSAARQRGVVLLFSLIALVIMLIAAVALVRSFNSSMFTAGNIAFKRDLQNQGERAVSKVLDDFRTGGLNSPTLRSAVVASSNYTPTMFTVNAQGIPDALLLDDSTFAASYTAPDLLSSDGSVRVRYVIDRLCSVGGDETTLGSTWCTLANNPTPTGSSSSNLQSAERAPLCPTCSSATPQGVVYRVSVKVSGPRNTQSFFQSTLTVPSS
jgi:type IV pilus assembly protein PilX